MDREAEFTPIERPKGRTIVWFYTRDGHSLRFETRVDHQTRAYVGILTFPNGHQDRQRFQTARVFRDWLISVDRRLLAAQWTQEGAPQILPDVP